ncbi:hypothetical protein RRG08_057650 [Elysia crispata]|uniref:Uncharacterized protein n=1 Tax=Elysia crispata TaxID=231223 RepID=A0AAE1DR62_9GAST|nr:hypothetical protein RRG08_057650 [Elysia crispata]
MTSKISIAGSREAVGVTRPHSPTRCMSRSRYLAILVLETVGLSGTAGHITFHTSSVLLDERTTTVTNLEDGVIVDFLDTGMGARGFDTFLPSTGLSSPSLTVHLLSSLCSDEPLCSGKILFSLPHQSYIPPFLYLIGQILF